MGQLTTLYGLRYRCKTSYEVPPTNPCSSCPPPTPQANRFPSTRTTKDPIMAPGKRHPCCTPQTWTKLDRCLRYQYLKPPPWPGHRVSILKILRSGADNTALGRASSKRRDLNNCTCRYVWMMRT
ncbi:uncharacterized protein PV07_00084 [Cladophialophora immunda]|uniref:Uncharacterized protein n=1 Tax=Cladophialophora immunda TaxID=569365 RepID=A0A0D1ZYL5_9EURO|nr:uncharacterized protein PV07_00084 [Cladophialophora immunda]KIW33216.1 hypothetical protein PV07_00084 [Cladophialophora immunda]